MGQGTKRMWLGTGLMATLVFLLFAFLISTSNEVHQKNVKEKGEWKLPEHLRKTGTTTNRKTRYAVVHFRPNLDSVVTPVTTVLTKTTTSGDSASEEKPQPQKIPGNKDEGSKVVVGISPTIQLLPTNAGTKPVIFANASAADGENRNVYTAKSDEGKTDSHQSEDHESQVQHLSDTEVLSGIKLGEGVATRFYFQTELTNHMVLLTALGIEKSNLLHPQLGYGFHVRDHLLIPRIGGVFSMDGYRGVSLGFIDQYHHGHNVLLVTNAEYTHSLKEAHESFAFIQVEGFRKVIGPVWLGGGFELLYEHEQSKVSEIADLELLTSLGMRIYAGKHFFIYAQGEYDLANLLERGAPIPHHWVMGNFGAALLLPHRKKT